MQVAELVTRERSNGNSRYAAGGPADGGGRVEPASGRGIPASSAITQLPYGIA